MHEPYFEVQPISFLNIKIKKKHPYNTKIKQKMSESFYYFKLLCKKKLVINDPYSIIRQNTDTHIKSKMQN